MQMPPDSVVWAPPTPGPICGSAPTTPVPQLPCSEEVMTILRALEERLSALEEVVGTVQSSRSPRRNVLRRLRDLERSS